MAYIGIEIAGGEKEIPSLDFCFCSAHFVPVSVCLACEVCYLPVDLARASMPSSPLMSPVIRNLNYVVDEQPE